MRLKLNLTAIEYRADPFTAFGRLRDMGTFVPARIPLIGNLWLATTYDAVNDVLKDDSLFCRNPKNAGRRNFPMLQLMMPGLFRVMAKNMIGMDEPDHRRLRSLVDQAFQRQSIDDLRPTIKQIVDDQLDYVEELAKQQNCKVELIEHLCRPVPLAAICQLLGLPAEDQPNFKKWFNSFTRIQSVWGIVKIVPGMSKTIKYLRHQIEEVRRNPRPGLMTALVEAEQAGDRLNDQELQSMVMLLLLAGHETTVHLITNAVLTLLQMPDVRDQLLADWTLVDPAVEEVLRYCSPVQFAKPRFVTTDTEFHGHSFKRGEVVMPCLASANYDPHRFEQPDRFIFDRPRNYHLDFGAGPHVCLGLKLARAETQIALERLFTRWPDLQPTFEPSTPDWSRRLGMRSLNSLEVRAA
ncbi:MAG: cytochrome P450 [Planctomycetales bacterium]|nr:cytochrome P450 [Planctomycetales bacterium]